MSARASRRGNTAAYGALPGAPISEIRTRKWSKEMATVGHLLIPKWVPDRENPTEALQKGAFKKSKGRKRGAGEVGRMTRSVRQHLDAPLELLSEYPVRVHYPSPARTTMALSTPASVPMPSPDTIVVAAASYPADQTSGVSTVPVASQGLVEQKHPEAAPTAQQVTQPTHRVAATVVKAESALAAPTTAAAPDPTLPIMPIMPPVSNQLMVDVPSDEQLEMVLDDLPMLDADDSFNLDALDPAFLPTSVPRSAQATSGMQSAEDSSASLSEDDASGNSGSSMPSVSPQSSPRVMSRSPSP